MSMMQVDTPENRTTYKTIAMTRTTGGGGSLVLSTFGDVVAFADLMSRSQHAIPAHLRQNPGACMAVTLLAMRLEIDPFALASKSYITKEGATIAYEAQLFAAIVHTRAPIKRNPDYTFEGQGDALKCTVSAEMKDGSVKVYTSPTLGRIPVKNSPLWKGDPEQQIGYYSIRAWARRYCPEVILGIYTPDELEGSPAIGPDRARDVTPAAAQPKPRGLAGKLDALAGGPAAEPRPAPAQREEPTGEVTPLPEHDPTTGEIDDASAEDGPANDDAPEDPRDALIGEIRSEIMDGGRKVVAILNDLGERRPLLTDADVAALKRAEKDFAAQAGGGGR